MKKLIIFCSFFFFTLNLSAQSDSNSCQSIVLTNDFEISASIDTIEKDFLFYKKCPGTSDVAYNLPIKIVKFIRDSTGQPDLLFGSLANLKATQSSRSKKRPITTWIFKHKIKKMVRSVSLGYLVKVKYLDSNGKTQKAKGRWKALTDKTLVLETKKEPEFTILKERIVKIKIPKAQRKATTGIGAGLAGAGIGLGVLALILAVGYASALTIYFLSSIFTPDKASNEPNSSGCSALFVISIIFIIGAGVLIIASGPKKVAYPFNTNKWEVIYPSEIDQQEFIKQP